MDKETQAYIDSATEKAATDAVAKMREFHQDDLKVVSERMDIGFERIDVEMRDIKSDLTEVKSDVIDIKDGIDIIDGRLDRLKDAFSTSLKEFSEDKEKVRPLEV